MDGKRLLWPSLIKNARILWALMTHQRNYEASHISTRPPELIA